MRPPSKLSASRRRGSSRATLRCPTRARRRAEPHAPHVARARAARRPRRRRRQARAAVARRAPTSGALFLRADRLEGTKKRVEAERQRRAARRAARPCSPTRFPTTSRRRRDPRQGQRRAAPGQRLVSGPELTFKRDTRDRLLRVADASRSATSARAATPSAITFPGPDLYEVTDGRYTTCVAPREDWFLRAGEIDIDTARMVGTAHDARFDFMGVPILYSPWLEFPLSNERKSGFLTPTLGSSGTRGFDFALPYYFNLAPNYDATVTPRIMTKRGAAGRRRVPLPVQRRGDAEPGPGRRRGASRRPRRPTTTRWLVLVAAQPAVGAVARAATATSTRSPTTRTSPTSPIASRSRRRRRCRAKRGSPRRTVRGRCSRACRSSRRCRIRTRRSRRRTTACRRSSRRLREVDVAGLTFVGHRRVRALPPSARCVTDGDRARAVPAGRWRRRARRGSFAARGSVHARHYDLDAPLPDRDRSRDVVDPDRQPRRAAWSSSVTGASFGTRLHPDARAARVLRLHPVSQDQNDAAGVRYRARRLQLLAAVHREPLPRQRPHRRRQPAHARA